MCDRQTDVTAALRERQSELDSAERSEREKRGSSVFVHPPLSVVDDSISVVTEQSEKKNIDFDIHPSTRFIEWDQKKLCVQCRP